MADAFYRGEKVLVRDVPKLQIASCSFEFLDESGQAMLIVAARTDVTNLARIERKFERPVLRDGEMLLCSFCGKSQIDVATLIAGPRVYICNACIEICDAILADDVKVETPEPEPEPPKKRRKRKPKP